VDVAGGTGASVGSRATRTLVSRERGPHAGALTDSSCETPSPSLGTGLRRPAPSAMNPGTGMGPAKDEEIPSPFPKGRLTLAGLGARQICSSEQSPFTGSWRSYEFAIRNFVHWYCSEPRLALNRIVVTRYRMQLEQLHLAPPR
jgi:hypothetical protein